MIGKSKLQLHEYKVKLAETSVTKVGRIWQPAVHLGWVGGQRGWRLGFMFVLGESCLSAVSVGDTCLHYVWGAKGCLTADKQEGVKARDGEPGKRARHHFLAATRPVLSPSFARIPRRRNQDACANTQLKNVRASGVDATFKGKGAKGGGGSRDRGGFEKWRRVSEEGLECCISRGDIGFQIVPQHLTTFLLPIQGGRDSFKQLLCSMLAFFNMRDSRLRSEQQPPAGLRRASS
jgi:hypothetical protein